MIRKYHNHTTLQTNPLYREEEPQNNNNHEIPGRKNKVEQLALSSPSRWLEIKKGHKVLETCNKPRTPAMGATINNESTTTEPPPTDSSLRHLGSGLKCILLVPNLRPMILLLLKHKPCLARMDTLVNVNAPVIATTSWWLHFSAPVVA